MSKDYYDILEVNKGASADEIKSAFKKKAMKYHPDRNKAADAEARFKEINEAYEVLGDPQKKKNYDRTSIILCKCDNGYLSSDNLLSFVYTKPDGNDNSDIALAEVKLV